MSAEYTLELRLRPRERVIVSHRPLSRFAGTRCRRSSPLLMRCRGGRPSSMCSQAGGRPSSAAARSLAAIVVLSLTSGKPGLKQLFRSMLKWRVAPRWWAVAILLPIAVTLAAAGMNIALGAQIPSGADLGRWTSVPPTALVILLIPLFGRSLGGAGLARIRSPSPLCSTLCAGGESRPRSCSGLSGTCPSSSRASSTGRICCSSSPSVSFLYLALFPKRRRACS